MKKSSTAHVVKTATAVAFAATFATGVAIAAGKHQGGHGHATAFGGPGKAADATRTVEVVMTDNEYNIPSIVVKDGETVRFVVKNQGEFLHEFNIGTASMHADHQHEMMEMFEHGMMDATSINHEMMKQHHGMKHDDPNATLLEPGKTAELVWTFKKAGHLEFACNIPGHYQTGMVGKITVTDRSS